MAESMFFEKFQMPTHQKPVVVPAALGTAGRVHMVDHLGDRLLGAGYHHLVLLRRFEGADRVVDREALAGIEAAVVAGVVPGQHLGLHRLVVEPLHELHRLAGLRAN